MERFRDAAGFDDVQSFLVGVPALLLSVAVIAYAVDSYLPKQLFTNLVLGLSLTAYFLARARRTWDGKTGASYPRVLALVMLSLAALSVVSVGYVQVVFDRWLETGAFVVYNNVDIIIGASLIVLVTIVTADKFGWILGALVVVTVIYGVGGPQLPSILAHGGISLETIIFKNTISLQGVYGFLTQIAATWVAIFVIFAGIVRMFGGFDLILQLTERLEGAFSGAVPQTAVVSSMFMGTMMGGAGVNVAATGSFTIPLMQERGILGKHSGAIESVASTAGQVLPPIMGSAAFIMSDILGIPFADVAIAATIPAILYYSVTSYGVYQWSLWYDWSERDEANEEQSASASDTGVDMDDTSEEPRSVFLLKSAQFLVPLVVLIYLLIVLRFGPLYSGMYTILTLFGTRLLYLLWREGAGAGAVRQYLGEIAAGLREGGASAAPFVALLAALAVVINIFSATGLTNRITFALSALTGTSFVGILVISMILALLFGLGIPTPAAYLLVATIIAPVIVELATLQGFVVEPIVAHMFVFYYALLSAITPPVALAVAMAITISGAEFIETAIESLRLGGPTFLIPFMFVFNPELIFWSFPETPIALVVQFVALMVALSVTMGIEFGRKLPSYERAFRALLFLIIAFGPSLLVQVAGVGVFALTVAIRGALPKVRSARQ
ncbi:TRAP transporter permease [Halobellus clavatus]|uniref:TRAP transporter, 4TM/12TM fusion protein n=1 Tax=Halobellus clavatus TaxID=660517 RepID=A0A1H3JLM7_9EURY|nr:TRAP transporter fused permease subunit [Halobellus clavatus]SDY40308.1 TRAP transporter, 4TM/12TM fusion protein [Halobellus clavatus]